MLVTVFITAGQLKESRRVRSLDTVLALHNRFLSPDLAALRQLLDGVVGPADPSSIWDTPDGLLLREMIDQMELLGALVRERAVDFDLVRAVFPFFARTWQTVEPYVMTRRSLGPRYERYGGNAEYLAKQYPTVDW